MVRAIAAFFFAGVAAEEERVLADEGVDAQGAFGRVVVGRQQRVVEEAYQRVELVADIARAFGQFMTEGVGTGDTVHPRSPSLSAAWGST